MRKERSDVRFVMWRKRVDKTLLKGGVTPIPTWLVDQWLIQEVFDFSNGSIPVLIYWGKDAYQGVVSMVQYEKRVLYRLEIKDPGHQWLINAYTNSYEKLVLNERQEETYEFLDIEFDPKSKTFFLNDYYKKT
jgi:hypothetical protein